MNGKAARLHVHLPSSDAVECEFAMNAFKSLPPIAPADCYVGERS